MNHAMQYFKASDLNNDSTIDTIRYEYRNDLVVLALLDQLADRNSDIETLENEKDELSSSLSRVHNWCDEVRTVIDTTKEYITDELLAAKNKDLRQDVKTILESDLEDILGIVGHIQAQAE